MSHEEITIDKYIDECFKKLKPIKDELENHIESMEKYCKWASFSQEQKQFAGDLADLMYFISET